MTFPLLSIDIHTLFPSLQNDEPVHLAPDPASGDVDLMDYENPADLLVALMQQLGGRASLSKLCKVGEPLPPSHWSCCYEPLPLQVM